MNVQCLLVSVDSQYCTCFAHVFATHKVNVRTAMSSPCRGILNFLHASILHHMRLLHSFCTRGISIIEIYLSISTLKMTEGLVLVLYPVSN